MSELRIGFVGLGVMGAPMSQHLLNANGRLSVYNRTQSKADPLLQAGAEFLELSEMARRCEIIILCVSRSEDARQCIQQLGKLNPETLIVDHSTIAPQAAKEIAVEVAQQGSHYVDAPVTGGSMGAKNGQLTIFLGGAEQPVHRTIEVVKPYTKRAERVGPSGSGQLAKMANQIAVAGSLLSLCECLSFAEKAQLDVKQICELVGGGAGGSWNFQNYGPKIIAKDWTPGFSVDNQLKDLDYCGQAAQEVGANIPATRLAEALLQRLQAEGHGAWTTAALYEIYREPLD